mmetsp:Transcript_32284/g.89175  ORF Transcript_32284/g.89175 Transcript_32284/m.89175 type:complete len:470 (-) Transcript_32284:311-1720(-)
MLCGICGDVEEATVRAVELPETLGVPLWITARQSRTKHLEVIEGGASAVLHACDRRAVRVQRALPHGVVLHPEDKLHGPLQQCVLADVERSRPAIAAVDDVPPLQHAVHWGQQRQLFLWRPDEVLLQDPEVGLLSAEIGQAKSRIAPGHLAKRAVPVRNRHDTLVHGATPLLGDEAAAHESVGAHASLPVRILSTAKRMVVCRPGLIDRATVVGREHDERVVVHGLIPERSHELIDGLVKVEDHGGIESAVVAREIVASKLPHSPIERLDGRNRYLQGTMDEMQRIEKEERVQLVRGIVRQYDILRALFEDMLLVARGVWLGGILARRVEPRLVPHTTAVGVAGLEEVRERIQAVVDLASGFQVAALRPIVVRVLEVPRPRVVTAAQRRVFWGRHTRVPLSHHVRPVAQSLQFLRHPSHVPRDACEAADGVILVHVRDANVQDVHVHGEAAALQRGAGGGANAKGVVPV